MAPQGPSLFICKEYTEDKVMKKNRTRKPLVEKIRRDRINGTITQLRAILEQDFQLLQPDSKLEKADILELVVEFLKRQRGHHGFKSAQMGKHQHYSEGYSMCLRETLGFLSIHNASEEMRARLVNHFQPAHSGAKDLSCSRLPWKDQPYSTHSLKDKNYSTHSMKDQKYSTHSMKDKNYSTHSMKDQKYSTHSLKDKNYSTHSMKDQKYSTHSLNSPSGHLVSLGNNPLWRPW